VLILLAPSIPLATTNQAAINPGEKPLCGGSIIYSPLKDVGHYRDILGEACEV